MQSFQNKTKVWSLSMRPYYDHYSQRYINIMTINSEPLGPLTSIVRRLNPSRLSDVSSRSNDFEDRPYQCLYAIEYLHNSHPYNNNNYSNYFLFSLLIWIQNFLIDSQKSTSLFFLSFFSLLLFIVNIKKSVITSQRVQCRDLFYAGQL